MAIRKYIPDFITSLNIVCGIIGVVFAFKGRLEPAFWMMIAAAVFDFLDGLCARALGAYSDFGKELDSLCDLVSFWVLPSVMCYTLMKTLAFGESIACWIPLVMTLAAALRLAKFNVDTAQADSFLGLPVPASALLCGSLCCYVCHDPACFLATWAAGPIFIPILALCLSALMLSRIPMFSFKFHKDDAQTLRSKRLAFVFIVIAAVLVCVLCRLHWSLAVLLSFICYILKNIVYAIARI